MAFHKAMFLLLRNDACYCTFCNRKGHELVKGLHKLTMTVATVPIFGTEMTIRFRSGYDKRMRAQTNGKGAFLQKGNRRNTLNLAGPSETYRAVRGKYIAMIHFIFIYGVPKQKLVAMKSSKKMKRVSNPTVFESVTPLGQCHLFCF